MEALLFFGGIALVFGGIIWAAVVQHRKMAANLQQLADRLGLDYVGKKNSWTKSPALLGTWQGRALRFWTYSTGSGKSRQTWSAVGIQPRKTGAVQLELRRQGFVTSVMEFFGSKEIQVGDPQFDRNWFIRTNRPEVVRAALVPEIRHKLDALDTGMRDNGYKLDGGWMQFAIQGAFADAKLIARLEARLPVLADLADVVEVAAAVETAR